MTRRSKEDIARLEMEDEEQSLQDIAVAVKGEDSSLSESEEIVILPIAQSDVANTEDFANTEEAAAFFNHLLEAIGEERKLRMEPQLSTARGAKLATARSAKPAAAEEGQVDPEMQEFAEGKGALYLQLKEDIARVNDELAHSADMYDKDFTKGHKREQNLKLKRLEKAKKEAVLQATLAKQATNFCRAVHKADQEKIEAERLARWESESARIEQELEKEKHAQGIRSKKKQKRKIREDNELAKERKAEQTRLENEKKRLDKQFDLQRQVEMNRVMQTTMRLINTDAQVHHAKAWNTPETPRLKPASETHHVEGRRSKDALEIAKEMVDAMKRAGYKPTKDDAIQALSLKSLESAPSSSTNHESLQASTAECGASDGEIGNRSAVVEKSASDDANIPESSRKALPLRVAKWFGRRIAGTSKEEVTADVQESSREVESPSTRSKVAGVRERLKRRFRGATDDTSATSTQIRASESDNPVEKPTVVPGRRLQGSVEIAAADARGGLLVDAGTPENAKGRGSGDSEELASGAALGRRGSKSRRSDPNVASGALAPGRRRSSCALDYPGSESRAEDNNKQQQRENLARAKQRRLSKIAYPQPSASKATRESRQQEGPQHDDARVKSNGKQTVVAKVRDDEKTRSAGKQADVPKARDRGKLKTNGKQADVPKAPDREQTRSDGEQADVAKGQEDESTASKGKQADAANDQDDRKNGGHGKQAVVDQLQSLGESTEGGEGVAIAVPRSDSDQPEVLVPNSEGDPWERTLQEINAAKNKAKADVDEQLKRALQELQSAERVARDIIDENNTNSSKAVSPKLPLTPRIAMKHVAETAELHSPSISLEKSLRHLENVILSAHQRAAIADDRATVATKKIEQVRQADHKADQQTSAAIFKSHASVGQQHAAAIDTDLDVAVAVAVGGIHAAGDDAKAELEEHSQAALQQLSIAERVALKAVREAPLSSSQRADADPSESKHRRTENASNELSAEDIEKSLLRLEKKVAWAHRHATFAENKARDAEKEALAALQDRQDAMKRNRVLQVVREQDVRRRLDCMRQSTKGKKVQKIDASIDNALGKIQQAKTEVDETMKRVLEQLDAMENAASSARSETISASLTAAGEETGAVVVENSECF